MSTPEPLPDPVQTDAARRAQLMQARAQHWQRARRVTCALLLLWFGATFLTVFYARELSTLTLFGWPLSFYLAAQGVALLNLAIVGIYALVLNRLDRRFARQLAQGAP